MALGTHDDSTLHRAADSKPRDKTFRELLHKSHVLLIERVEQVLDLASLCKQFRVVQEVEIAALNPTHSAYY